MLSSRPRSIRTPFLALLLLTLVASVTTFSAENDNWPAFRGANALPIAEDDPRLPSTWSATENVVWKTPVDGLGW